METVMDIGLFNENINGKQQICQTSRKRVSLSIMMIRLRDTIALGQTQPRRQL
jgi:hypothetical protein